MLTSEADDLMMLWSESIAERARGTDHTVNFDVGPNDGQSTLKQE
jgi:hypothetical protein